MKILDKEIFAVSPIRFKRDGKTDDSTATGFFYKDRDEFYFITNRHVVIDEETGFFPDELELNLHTDQNDLTKCKKFSIQLRDGEKKLWIEHQPVNEEYVDVAVLPVRKEDLLPHFHVLPFNESDLLHPSRYISIGDDLLVIGYPLGIRDTKHKTPIIRSAVMASVYPLPFDGKPYFLIDSFLHEGTSGSPILLKPSLLNRNIDSRARLNLDSRSSFERKLLGIHSGSFIPLNWNPCDEEQLRKTGCPRIGLNKVWFASLIPEIIKENKEQNCFQAILQRA